MKSRSFLAATILMFAATAAQAQEFVRADCRGVVQASTQVKFDSPQHANWYRRFWTGSCKDLPKLQCMPGSPNWNDVITRLTKKGRVDQAPAITTAACRMGQLIGHEWAREKAVRRIDTADLKTFLATLDTSPDVPTGLQRVETRVKTALGLKP
jgi:hypothetical protein